MHVVRNANSGEISLVQPEVEPRNDVVNGEEKKKWLQRWHIHFFSGNKRKSFQRMTVQKLVILVE
ncbi:hypothetical protein T01_9461 [Trichinella spiralis]|uniref:Uncharacterized protein n=1 Tax=Trichinella spiralis TaxID=6334 RepID=A0A0V1BLF7_TRISP|nr:hypothetical protein T01_9461 [Trichinella spiralis]